MFKKGSFEIGGTIYPVAIKVSGNSCQSNFKVWGSAFVRVVGSCLGTAANESIVALAIGYMLWKTPRAEVAEMKVKSFSL